MAAFFTLILQVKVAFFFPLIRIVARIFALPLAFALTTPFWLTDAIFGFVDFQRILLFAVFLKFFTFNFVFFFDGQCFLGNIEFLFLFFIL